MNIDITKPLMRGKMIQIDDLKFSWVAFNYERLPIFGYRCGILDHQDRECPQLKKGCFSADEDGFQFGPWLRSMAPKGNWKKDTRISFSDMRDDEEDDIQSLAEDDEALVQRRQLQMDPLLSVPVMNPGKSVLFGTTSGRDCGELVWEKSLIPSSMGGLNSQLDGTAKNKEVASNSNSGKGDYPILSDLVYLSPVSNLKLRDNLDNSHESKYCDKAETHVTKIAELSSSNKAPHISCWDLEKEARNFKIPLEKLPDISEDIEMKSLIDVVAEIPELKTTSLRSWKQIIRDKQILNSKDSSTSMLVPAKRHAGASDPTTNLDTSHKQKKQSIEKDNFQAFAPTIGVGTQPLSRPNPKGSKT